MHKNVITIDFEWNNWFGKVVIKAEKIAENWTGIGAEICTGTCQYKWYKP
jgi:hypothetical protein